MSDIIKYAIDAVIGAALLFALLVVFVVDRFLLNAAPAAINTLDAEVKEDTARPRFKRLKIAVTPTERTFDPFTKQAEPWDDMGKLLLELGEGYKYDEVSPQEFLVDPKKLGEYEVLFLTCKGGGEELKDALREFVSNGGILYASDWRYDAVAAAFPDVVDEKLRGKGAPQALEADVVDPALREFLGPKIPLNFELGDWKPAAFSGPRVQTLLQGKYQKMGQRASDPFTTAPLMVKFSFGKGTVIFTSFHHEKKNSKVEKQLLSYLIFSLVTAGVDTEVNTTMEKGGFVPQRSNLLSTPKNQGSVTKDYDNARVGALRFALGFRNEGAKMRLTIVSPDKKKSFSKDCVSTMTVDIPNAAAGRWTYTVEALELPYPNFPFTVTVGEKK